MKTEKVDEFGTEKSKSDVLVQLLLDQFGDAALDQALDFITDIDVQTTVNVVEDITSPSKKQRRCRQAPRPLGTGKGL